LRILLGTVEIAGQIPIFADGFRRLGHQVTTAICGRNHLYPHIQYDVDICREFVQWSWKVNRALQLTRLPRLIASHDVFVFHWGGTSLTFDNSEYPLLKKLGKKIVSLFCGDDVRHPSAYNQEFVFPEESLVRLEDLSEAYQNVSLVGQLRNMRIAELHSDLIVSAPNLASLAVRPYVHFLVPVDLSEYKGHIQGREVPIIIHAPTSKGVKGTSLILPALEQLRAEGLQFQLRLLDGVPHQQVLPELANADVVIDQLHLPNHGKLGVEAMASGCALVSRNREDYEPFPPHRPIWNIEPDNLYTQLKRILTDHELRVRLASEGRRYVERYHDHVGVARRILKALNPNDIEKYDHYPDFFARRYELPKGLKITEDLKRITARIVQRWGLPEGVDAQDMIARGLMSADGLDLSEPIPRWKPASSAAII
jgi:Glycosyl transferases group 1